MFENESSPLEQHLPAFIPADFVRSDRSLWFNRTHVGLQLFFHNPGGQFLCVELSEGPIADLMSSGEAAAARIQIEMGGCQVGLVRIERRSRSGQGAQKPLVVANWRRQDVYYRLQSDGLSMDDLAKIIASVPG